MTVNATTATASPTLTPSKVTQTGAVLTISNHSAAWYYRQTVPNTGTRPCTARTSTQTTATLSGLTANTSYTYKAYSDSNCATEITSATTDADFKTLDLTATSVTSSGAKLTIVNHTGSWWYQRTAPPPRGSCRSAGSAATVDLSGLNANTQYGYRAYSGSACQGVDLLASKTFRTSTAASVTPAPAPRGIWNATLTVDQETSGPTTYRGCGKQDLDACTAGLTATTFTWGGTLYGVDALWRQQGGGPNSLSLQVRPHWPDDIKKRGILSVGGREFAFSNASFSKDNQTFDNVATWNSPGFNWTDNQSVSVSLRLPLSDHRRPKAVGYSPTGGASYGTNTDLVLTFDEPVKKGAGTITLTPSSGTAVTVSVTSNQVTVSGNKVVINPSSNLATQKTWTVTMPAGAFKDMSDNQYAGLSGTTWQFLTTTGTDSSAPTVSSTGFSPADDATSVPPNTNLTLTFNEPVKKGTGNITITPAAGSATTIAVTSSQVSVSGDRVTIDPTSDLVANAATYVQIASGAFTDLAGNAYAGISNQTDWNFTVVGSSAGPSAPTLTATPRNGRVLLTWTAADTGVPATGWQYRYGARTGACSGATYGAWKTMTDGRNGYDHHRSLADRRSRTVNRGLTNGTRYCFQVRGYHTSGSATHAGTASAGVAATPNTNLKPTVKFDAPPQNATAYAVTEQGNTTVRVSLSAALSPAAAVTIPLRVVTGAGMVDGVPVEREGNAEPGDYGVPASVTISASATSASITVSGSRAPYFRGLCFPV